jgi:hypothetical protein
MLRGRANGFWGSGRIGTNPIFQISGSNPEKNRLVALLYEFLFKR